MRRICSLVLTVLLALPAGAFAAGDEDTTDDAPKAVKKKKHKVVVPKKKKAAVKKPDAEDEDATETTDSSESSESTEPEAPPAPAPKRKLKPKPKPVAEDEEEAAPEVVEEPSKPWPAHRYAFIGGGVILAGGLAFAYAAQGEAKRAETIGTAKEATRAIDNARAAAATSNVMYGLAVGVLAYATLLEFLPERISNRLALTFHF